MKTILIATTLLYSAFSFSAVECSTSEHKFLVENSRNELLITYKGETVIADGALFSDEVDLVAKFKLIGEMTLFAKIGKSGPDNYVFIKGKRFSVICR